MTDLEMLAVVKKINELFITYRKKFIVQNKKDSDFKFSTIDKYSINDTVVKRHLQGKQTCGIFSGKAFTKFISFDVDTKENSEVDTRYLVDILEREFNIARSDIHVSISGMKGYHVDLYFKNQITNNLARKFYIDVINRAEFTEKQIELRPQHSLGMKLPLGIHEETKKRCWYVDNQTFKPIEDFNYIFDIQQIDPSFLEIEYQDIDMIKVNTHEANEFENVISSVKTDTFEVEDHLEHINYILENNQLKHEASRNNMTYLTSIYLKEVEQLKKSTVIEVLTSIMLNSKRLNIGLISESSTESSIIRETKRIVEVVYKQDYKFTRRNKDVIITKEDIETILKIKKWNLKRLYLIHLIQFRRYATKDNSYYMSYQTMTNFGATTDRGRLRKQIQELEDMQLMKLKQSKAIDEPRTLSTGTIIYKPNVYQMNLSIKKIFENDIDGITIKDNEDISLEKILKMFDDKFQLNLKKKLSYEQYLKVNNAS
ncbi:hypothetical protein ETI06_13030 [Macrococcoides goetzii]|nr:hypothetical protein [Macrococcus goetzii]TDM45169.1 hypothetical protein ETI06_13030 [Macrococcus goetzii]